MLLQKYYISLWLRVFGIVLTSMAIAYFSLVKIDWLYLVNSAVLLIIQVVLLVRSQNTINRELEQFMDSLRGNDHTSTFARKKGSHKFQVLARKFDEISADISKLKADKLQQSQFLSTLIEHISIGLITIGNKGKVLNLNSAAKRMLGLSNLHFIDGIASVDYNLHKAIVSIKPEEQMLVSLNRDGYLLQLSLRASVIKLQEDSLKIVSIQNIQSELDQREMEGWQKLIRVLTHELMNSAGPISSTISTLIDLLDENSKLPNGQTEFSPDVISDIIQGLKIIEERSLGMIDFVTRFRSLTLIPQPKLEKLNIDDLFKRIIVLMDEEICQSNIKINTSNAGSGLTINADKGMMEQILINLIKNAIDAVSGIQKPSIKLSCWSDSADNIYIDIADNGKGVSAEYFDKIFVPFFTTRKNGSGVGLSLSRQLANVQGGMLALTKSSIGDTVFTLKFSSKGNDVSI